MIVMTIFTKMLIMINYFWGSVCHVQSLCRKYYITESTDNQTYEYLFVIKNCSFSNKSLSVNEHFVL